MATDAEVDTDGDGVSDAADNCPTYANAGQSDNANAKERAHGSDERDPRSYPPKGRKSAPLG